MASFVKKRQLYVMRKGVENDFFIHLVCAFEVFTFLTALVDLSWINPSSFLDQASRNTFSSLDTLDKSNL